MIMLSRDGLSIEQLESMLEKFGQFMGENDRRDRTAELFRMKATPVEVPVRDPILAASAKAVYHSHDWSMGPPETHNFAGWAAQYRIGLNAVHTVLEFLEAQEHMELFASNEEAARVYRAIIWAGVQKIILNR